MEVVSFSHDPKGAQHRMEVRWEDGVDHFLYHMNCEVGPPMLHVPA